VPTAGGQARSRELLSLLHFPGLISIIMIVPGVIIGPVAFFVREDFDFTKSDIGTSFAMFFLFSALASGRGAFLVPRLGAHTVMRFALLGAAAVLVGLGFTQSRVGVLVCMCIGGALNGVASVAVSITILSSVALHRRGLAFGLRTAGLPSAAAVAGLGGSLVAAEVGTWRQLMWVTSLVAVVAAMTIRKREPSSTRAMGSERSPARDIGTGRTLVLLRIGGFLGAVATAAVTPYFVENLVEHDMSPGRASAVLAVAGWLGVVMRLAVGAVSDKIANPIVQLRVSAGCLVVLGASATVLTVADESRAMAAATVLACGLGFAWPGLWMYAALQTHAAHAARVAGQLALGQHSGAVVGPLAFGFVLTHQSFSTAWACAALVAATAAAMLLTSVRLLRDEAEASGSGRGERRARASAE
jgi:predicted MFS family arabinose efflux permease